VQPGSFLMFSFVSASAPAAINGNSVDYPGTPVNTAFVYPGAPFSDAGHQFVATPTPAPTPTPIPTPTPTPTPAPTPTPPALVSVTDVELETNKKHMVTQIIVDFSGAVNVAEADSVGTYRLATAGKKGSFTAKNAAVLKLKSAVDNGALDQVTLTPKRAFALTKPVQLAVEGQTLQDSSGRMRSRPTTSRRGS
jgi:hypothetical protein